MNDGRDELKRRWTVKEDEILTEYVRRHGEGKWNNVRRYTGLARDGDSCRCRWKNYLRSNLTKGPFTPEEKRTVEVLHARIGNKWVQIAAQLPGRTDNEIKNFWNIRAKHRERKGLPLYTADIQPNPGTQELAHSPLPLPLPSPHNHQTLPHNLNNPSNNNANAFSFPQPPLYLQSSLDFTRSNNNNLTAMNLSNTTTLSFPPFTTPVNRPNSFPVTPADPSYHMSMPHSFPVTPAGPSNRMSMPHSFPVTPAGPSNCMSMPHSFPVTPAGPSNRMSMPHSFPVTPAGPSNRMSMPTYSQLPPFSSNPHTYSTSNLFQDSFINQRQIMSSSPHSPYWITPDLHSNQIPSLNAQHFGSHSRMWRDNENDNSNNTNRSRLGILDEAEALNSDDGGSQEYKRSRLMSPACWGSTGNTSCSYSEVRKREEDSIQMNNAMNNEGLKNMLDGMLSTTGTCRPQYNGGGEISNGQSSGTRLDNLTIDEQDNKSPKSDS